MVKACEVWLLGVVADDLAQSARSGDCCNGLRDAISGILGVEDVPVTILLFRGVSEPGADVPTLLGFSTDTPTARQFAVVQIVSDDPPPMVVKVGIVMALRERVRSMSVSGKSIRLGRVIFHWVNPDDYFPSDDE